MVLALLLALQAAGSAAPQAETRAARPARFDAATFDRLVEQGVARGAYPGAVLVVGRRDEVLFAKGYGHFTWSPSSAVPDPDSTLYDLASLTKVVATTTVLMLLVDRGQVQLDAPVARYIPEFDGPGTEAITVRELLTHTSGLRATLPLFRATPDSAAALRMVFATTPIAPPGARVIYSDLNAILLGEIVHRVAGEPLDVVAAREIFRPLGLRRMLFRPGRDVRPQVAPTGLWRGHAIAGVVNDQNAARLGGVAGHAGLFSTAVDLSVFARMLLNGGVAPACTPTGVRGEPCPLARSAPVRLLDPDVIASFTSRYDATSSRALGWDTPEGRSSAGDYFTTRAFGHTGFTGTSIWIDPDLDMWVVLLTNRVHPTRENQKHVALRRAVHDAAALAITDRVLEPRAP